MPSWLIPALFSWVGVAALVIGYLFAREDTLVISCIIKPGGNLEGSRRRASLPIAATSPVSLFSGCASGMLSRDASERALSAYFRVSLAASWRTRISWGTELYSCVSTMLQHVGER